MKVMRVIKATLRLVKNLPLIWYHHFVKQLVIQDLRSRGLDVSRTSVIHGSGRISCGGTSSVGAFSIIWCDDDPHGTPQGARLVLGKNVYIGDLCSIRAAGSPVIIGDNVLIANSVTIVSANHGIKRGELIRNQPWETSENPVTIGNDVWIGAHAIILPGATISDGSVIAAGAVVRSFIPPNEIWGGIPAKKLKDR